MKAVLICFGFGILLADCTDPTDPNSVEANSMALTLDGTRYEGLGGHASGGTGHFHVYGADWVRGFGTIDLVIARYPAKGRYELKPLDHANYAEYRAIGGTLYSTAQYGGTGTLSVTSGPSCSTYESIDLVYGGRTRSVTTCDVWGTFEFVAHNEIGESKTIRNGRFNVMYQTQ